MNKKLQKAMMRSLNVKDIQQTEVIQSLWSGYGTISKAKITGDYSQKVVVKHICPPAKGSHPRGWNTNLSHQRKLKSYLVEMAWYRHHADKCGPLCRVPDSYLSLSDGDEHLIVLEDLDDSGYAHRKSTLTIPETKVCLSWLANFHARFMNQSFPDLWKKGSYWHLDTRPDEWDAMSEGKLKHNAREIDRILDECKYKTIIHGDAKVANFCFNADYTQVAAVDFQYVGGGCGMKDVSYLLGSCLGSNECERYDKVLLDHYFNELQMALEASDFKGDFSSLEQEWREMYAVAWTDFTRFLQGWMPGHQKLNSYSNKLMNEVLGSL